MITIGIKRQGKIEAFRVSGNQTLLSALYEIKRKHDPTLTFSAGCRSSVCGTCAVTVNGKEALACAHKVDEDDLIEPLKNHTVLRDLKVDKSNIADTLMRAKGTLLRYKEAVLDSSDEQESQRQSDCILCSSCYSACPVFSVNEAFLGPFALTRVWRYTIDPREEATKEHIDAVQPEGIWDCTLCNECTLACPKGIDPKTDILMLRGKSMEFGFGDPNFTTLNFGSDFTDFGV